MKLIKPHFFWEARSKREGKEEFSVNKVETISLITYFLDESMFANNAVSVAADIIREFSFMQLRFDIKRV